MNQKQQFYTLAKQYGRYIVLVTTGNKVFTPKTGVVTYVLSDVPIKVIVLDGSLSRLVLVQKLVGAYDSFDRLLLLEKITINRDTMYIGIDEKRYNIDRVIDYDDLLILGLKELKGQAAYLARSINVTSFVTISQSAVSV